MVEFYKECHISVMLIITFLLNWFRLSVYDLVEHKVQGDGNCQVSNQLGLIIF